MFNKKLKDVKVEKKDEHWHCIECGRKIEGVCKKYRRWTLITPNEDMEFDVSINAPMMCDECYQPKKEQHQKELEIQCAIEKDRAERKEVSGKKTDIKKYLDETIAQLEKIKKELDT